MHRGQPSIHKFSLADELAEAFEPPTPNGHTNGDLSLVEEQELSFASSSSQPTSPSYASRRGRHPKSHKSSASLYSVSVGAFTSGLARRGNAIEEHPDEEHDGDAHQASAAGQAELRACAYTFGLFLNLLQQFLVTKTALPTPSNLMLSSTTATLSDTIVAEQGVSAHFKLLYEHAKRREHQVEQLQSITKRLDDPDPAWQADLLETGPLAAYGGEADTLQHASTLSSQPPHHLDTAHLSGIRHATDDVLDAFAGIAENIQIGRATLNDAQRKIKFIEGALQRLRSEQESIDRSQQYIEQWQQKETEALFAESGANVSALPGLSARRPRSRKTSQNSAASSRSNGSAELSGRYAKLVRAELHAAQSSLEQAHQQATLLLVAA